MFKFLILSTFYRGHGDKNPFLYMFEFDKKFEKKIKFHQAHKIEFKKHDIT